VEWPTCRTTWEEWLVEDDVATLPRVRNIRPAVTVDHSNEINLIITMKKWNVKMS